MSWRSAITPRLQGPPARLPRQPHRRRHGPQSLEAVADVVERNDLFVISDEIYDRLVYGVEHVSFASLPGMKERTILLGGFSKSYAMTGWRLGLGLRSRRHHRRDDAACTSTS